MPSRDGAERYAQDAPYWGTDVPVERTRQNVLGMLERYGVKDWAWARRNGVDELIFVFEERRYRIAPHPLPVRPNARTYLMPDDHARKASDQAWRALEHYLAAVLKLSEFQPLRHVMMSHRMLDGGITLAEIDDGDPGTITGLLRPALPAPKNGEPR